jgi:ribonuclease P protein subunit RPR2
MRRKHKRKSKDIRLIAASRIARLFEQAALEFHEDPRLSDRYVVLAQRIAMKCKCTIPVILRRQVCAHCNRYLVPGSNARVRITGKTITYYCSACKGFSRYGYRKRKGRGVT